MGIEADDWTKKQKKLCRILVQVIPRHCYTLYPDEKMN